MNFSAHGQQAITTKRCNQQEEIAKCQIHQDTQNPKKIGTSKTLLQYVVEYTEINAKQLKPHKQSYTNDHKAYSRAKSLSH